MVQDEIFGSSNDATWMLNSQEVSDMRVPHNIEYYLIACIMYDNNILSWNFVLLVNSKLPFKHLPSSSSRY